LKVRTLGRPSKAADEQHDQIAADYAAGVSSSELARRFAVSRADMLGIVKPTA